MLKLNLIEPVVFHTRKLGVRFGIALRGGAKILPSFLRRTGENRGVEQHPQPDGGERQQVGGACGTVFGFAVRRK